MKMSKRIVSVLLALMLFSSCAVIGLADCAHKYDATYYPPTCNDRGYTEYVCSVCGDRIQEGFVDAIGHIYGEWEVLTEATCTSTGLEKRICRVCGGVETKTTPMLAHVDTDKDGTCDHCDFIFEDEDDGKMSPYEWFKMFFRNIIAWLRAIFA